MKYIIYLNLLFGLTCLNMESVHAQTKPLSPHKSAMAMVGDAHIHIDYSSPGIRDRVIFGGLVPYDVLWRAGAGDATWIESNKDLMIGGNALPAGKYAIFIIPNIKSWTIIFNSRWDQHGSNKYKESEDVLRVEVAPNSIIEPVEHLEYRIEQKDNSEGLIILEWEKYKVSIPFKIIK